MLRKGTAISSLIVEVLILILIVILIPLVIMWAMGLWQATGKPFSVTPIVRVTRNSAGSAGNPVLELRITNKGGEDDVIIRVAIKAGDGFYINTTSFNIPKGFAGTITIKNWGRVGKPQALKPGQTCRVYIYTRAHGMLFYDVVVSRPQ